MNLVYLEILEIFLNVFKIQYIRRVRMTLTTTLRAVAPLPTQPESQQVLVEYEMLFLNTYCVVMEILNSTCENSGATCNSCNVNT